MQSHLMFYKTQPSWCCKQNFWKLSNISPSLCEFSLRMKRLITVKEIYSWAVLLKLTNNLVWFLTQDLFDFSPSVVHLTLFKLFFRMQKRRSYSNTYIKTKNQNTKRRMETKNITYFCFWIKQSYRVSSMKNTSSMSKDNSNFNKAHFGCYFCCSLVNFKNIIIFWNTWIVYDSWKCWRSIAFDSEDIKNNF